MGYFSDGDRSAAICETCNRKVTTTMRLMDYRPEGAASPVPGVLVAVCDECGAVVGIPHQSAEQINAHRKGEMGAG